MLGFATACSNEDDDAIKIQPHDQNQIMTVMHDMMAEMETMRMTQDPDVDYAEMMKVHRSAFSPHLCRVWADVCNTCAKECEKHAAMGMDHCRQCAEVCRTCAKACEGMATPV